MSRQNDIDRTLVRTARALLDWTQPDLAKAANTTVVQMVAFSEPQCQLPRYLDSGGTADLAGIRILCQQPTSTGVGIPSDPSYNSV
jgi:hypothetical protein